MSIAPGQPATAADVMAAINGRLSPTGDASATMVAPMFSNGASAPYPRALADILGNVVSLKSCGALGNGGDDSAAIATWVNKINAIGANSSTPFPVCGLVEQGFYVCSAQPPAFTVPVRIVGTEPRGAVFFPIGGFDFLRFIGGGNGVALDAAGITGVFINGAGMTGIHSAVYCDTVADFLLQDNQISSVPCGVTIQQCSNTIVEKLVMSGFSTYGFKAYGDYTSRNGGTNTNNVLTFRDFEFGGSADGKRTTNAAIAIWLDGAIQTVRMFGGSLINAGRGLWVTNTPGIANPFFMQFLYAYDLEVENMLNEALRLECGTAYELHSLFVAGAGSNAVENSAGAVVVTTSSAIPNIYLGAIGRAKFLGGESSAAGGHGMDIQGPKSVELHGFDSYFNSQAEGSVYSGINIGAVDRFSMIGGLSGANKAKLHDAGYAAETQLWGINNANTVSGAHVSAFDADLTGNASAGGPNTGGTILNLSTCRTS